MDATYHSLALDIYNRAKVFLSQNSRRRYLVAIAGAPGSGKTTTASHVVNILNSFLADDDGSRQRSTCNPRAICIPMDGFHLPRATLDQLPNRTEAYLRRGAPWTFNAAGVVSLVRRLVDSATIPPAVPMEAISVPSFDHALKDPVDNGIVIPSSAEIVILEGNYLLLDEEGWRDIAALVDLKVFIDVDLEKARRRVAERHVRAGIESNLEDAYKRVDGNDYLNGILIKQKLIEPDLVVVSVEDREEIMTHALN